MAHEDPWESSWWTCPHNSENIDCKQQDVQQSVNTSSQLSSLCWCTLLSMSHDLQVVPGTESAVSIVYLLMTMRRTMLDDQSDNMLPALLSSSIQNMEDCCTQCGRSCTLHWDAQWCYVSQHPTSPWLSPSCVLHQLITIMLKTPSFEFPEFAGV